MLDDGGETELHRAAAQVGETMPGRWFAAMRAAYELPDATEDQIFQVAAGGLFQGSLANIASYELAVAAAELVPEPIEFIPLTAPEEE